jgi:hypothetical protein
MESSWVLSGWVVWSHGWNWLPVVLHGRLLLPTPEHMLKVIVPVLVVG